jgi:hypothetical protein
MLVYPQLGSNFSAVCLELCTAGDVLTPRRP